MSESRLMQKLVGVGMMAAGVAIVAVFGGGLILFLWRSVVSAMSGSHVADVMATVLVAPIVGGVPALLGLVLLRMGWRRCRPDAPPAVGPTTLGEDA